VQKLLKLIKFLNPLDIGLSFSMSTCRIRLCPRWRKRWVWHTNIGIHRWHEINVGFLRLHILKTVDCLSNLLIIVNTVSCLLQNFPEKQKACKCKYNFWETTCFCYCSVTPSVNSKIKFYLSVKNRFHFEADRKKISKKINHGPSSFNRFGEQYVKFN
jgi:hypothetical protein